MGWPWGCDALWGHQGKSQAPAARMLSDLWAEGWELVGLGVSPVMACWWQGLAPLLRMSMLGLFTSS